MDKDNAYFLLIDTSTDACSVALGDTSGKIYAQEISYSGRQHSALIATYADHVMSKLPAGSQLSAVGVSEGPGSYTGLRIAASFAKALCMTMNIPLISMTTPALLAHRCLEVQESHDDALIMPMIDARRMEVYTALYDTKGQCLRDIEALVLDSESVLDPLRSVVGNRPLYLCGDGAKKTLDVVRSVFPSVVYVSDVYPEARAMLSYISAAYASKDFCDVAYWTPYYLKEYEAKKSINKVIGNART